MALGVIDQPVALAGEITIQPLQGGPQLSRGCDGLSATRLALEMMHDRANTIDADPGIFGVAVPNAPVQSLDLRDDRSLRRDCAGSSADRALPICFRCWSRMTI